MLITRDKLDKLLLILAAYFNRRPSVCVYFCFSLPAKSINVILECLKAYNPALEISLKQTFISNTLWDLDDVSFILVYFTDLTAIPCFINRLNSS